MKRLITINIYPNIEMDDLKLEEAKNNVNCALLILFKNDIFLLENNVNERSLTHKLAEYLQFFFRDWDVDCEYNRVGKDKDEPKLLECIQECCKYTKKNDTENFSDVKGKTVYPDIVIHRRGETDKKSNLLIIEAKKFKKNEDNVAFECDRFKIEQYCKQINYRFGLFVILGRSFDESKQQWFIDGDWEKNTN